MSCCASGSASGPSPLPPGPWQRSQCFLNSVLPVAAALASPANGFFSSAAFGGSVPPPARGAGCCEGLAVEVADCVVDVDVVEVAWRALTAKLATNKAPAVANTLQRVFMR